MVFSSNLFLYYFLPVALLAYYVAPRAARNAILTVLSYAFYGWSNPAFTLLLMFSTGVDFLAGLVMERSRAGPDPSPRDARRARLALFVSVATNLSLLGFFKYFNLFLDTWNDAVRGLGASSLDIDAVLRVTLPLGISFYTFQSMSYSIDVFRGRVRAQRNLIDFACYVSMFPQLVAGPIVRYADVADQLGQRTHSISRAARGVAIFTLGLAKKVALANPCGQVADAAFALDAPSAFQAWLGVFSYALQIYFDFSGYSDMAIGLGLLLGFVLPINFDDPYRARSITDFWRRWHISLSSWLRDYLYVPLGGNRRGRTRTFVNLMIVMLLGGLWHGADWKFLVWGGWHGGWLALERLRGGRPLYAGLAPPLQVAATFLIVLIGWVPFRADSLGDAWRLLQHMVGAGTTSPAASLANAVLLAPYLILTVLVAAGVVWTAPQSIRWCASLTPARVATVGGLLAFTLALLSTQSYNPFIYFIF